jgi:hypothetical protein
MLLLFGTFILSLFFSLYLSLCLFTEVEQRYLISAQRSGVL